MKVLLFALLSSILTTLTYATPTETPQRYVWQRGSSEVTLQRHYTGHFHRLSIDGEFEVILSQGTRPGLAVEADDNLHDAIEWRNDGGDLHIYLRGNIASYSRLRLYISVADLQALSLDGVAALTTRGTLLLHRLDAHINTLGRASIQLQADQLRAQVAGAGDLWLAGQVQHLALHTDGFGQIQASQLRSNRLSLRQAGTAEVEFQVQGCPPARP